jgi:hypothetical protein
MGRGARVLSRKNKTNTGILHSVQDDDAKPRHSSGILLYFGVRVRVWVMVASTAELVKGMGRVVP